MTDRPVNAARHSRASVKEAIGKLMGDDAAVAEGKAEKKAADAAELNATSDKSKK